MLPSVSDSCHAVLGYLLKCGACMLFVLIKHFELVCFACISFVTALHIKIPTSLLKWLLPLFMN